MRGTISAGQVLVPGYTLVQFLGKGGFGEVWKATGPGRVPLAMKIIELKGSRAGQREFRSLDLLRELRHPNLLPLQGYWLLDEAGNDVGEQGEAHTLVIAMLLGEKSLRQRLEECQQVGWRGIPIGELMEYMHDAAKGIDFLNSPTHDFGDGPVSIQHRDIKPENLLIVGGGVMLADFGIARVLGSDSNVVMTETAAMTIWYAAPELFDYKATIWTDQYALAISYVELRAGRLPFPPNSTPTTVMAAHLRGSHDLSNLTPAEQTILRRATAANPSDRFSSCLELVAELATALQNEADFSQQAVASNAAAAATGAYAGDAAKQLDLIVRSSSLKNKNRKSGDLASEMRVTDAYHGDATKGDKPADNTAPLAAVTGNTASGMSGPTTSVASRRPRWALAAVAAGLLLLPLGWWAGTRIFRSEASPPPSDAGNVKSAGSGLEAHTGSKSATSSDDLVKTAREAAATAMQNGRFTEAIAALEPLVRDEQATANDFKLRARAYVGLADSGDDPAGNLARAADDFAHATAAEEQADALLKLGRWLAANGRPRDAIAPLTKSVEIDQRPEAMLALSEANLSAGHPDAARDTALSTLSTLKQAGREETESAAQAHRTAAQSFARLADQRDKAEPRDSKQVEDADTQAETHLLTAVALATKLSLDELDAWQRELGEWRERPRVAAWIKARELLATIADLRKQLDKSPQDATLLVKLAEAEEFAGQKDQATEHFVRGYSRRAVDLATAGKVQEAEEAVERAAEHDAEFSLVHFARGLIQTQRGDDVAAIRTLGLAIERSAAGDADRWQIFAARASAHARCAAGPDGENDDWQQAQRDADSGLQAAPKLTTPTADQPYTHEHRQLAKLHHVRASALEAFAGNDRTPAAAKLLDDAAQSRRKAIELDDQEIQYLLAAARHSLRRARGQPASAAATRLQEAERFVQGALKISGSAETHNLQGELFLLQGKGDAAQAAFEKAANIAEQDSNDRPLLFGCCLNLAYAYLRAPADNAKALAAADRAVAAQNDDPAGHFARGLALRNLKRTSDAITAFDAALAIQPKHVGSLLAKSQLILEMQDATSQQIDQANKDIDTATAEAATDDQKAEASYVHSLARLKAHVSNATQPAVAEPALVQAQRDLVQAIKLVPTNTVYTSAATELFTYAARYAFKDAKLKAESDKLHGDLKAARSSSQP